MKSPRQHRSLVVAQGIARRNRRRRVDPSYGLCGTHNFGVSGEIDLGTAFPDRSLPVTFTTKIRRTGTPDGIFLDFGVAGFVMYWDGPDLHYVEALATGHSDDVIAADGVVADIVIARRPSADIGSTEVWVNGRLSKRYAFPTPSSTWAGDVTAKIGDLYDSEAVSGLVPEAKRIPMEGVEIIQPLKAFNNQLPRRFAVAGPGT